MFSLLDLHNKVTEKLWNKRINYGINNTKIENNADASFLLSSIFLFQIHPTLIV